MTNAQTVVQYRITRPQTRRANTIVVIQRPVRFAVAPTAPRMVPQQTRTAVSLAQPRDGKVVVKPPDPLRGMTPQLLSRPNGRQHAINVPRTYRPGALAHVARERDQMFAASRANIQALKGIGRGRILVIVGNGPSHREAALERLKGNDKIDIMSINKPDQRVWPTRWWCFVDQSQVDRHRDLWNDYKGTAINSGSVRDRKGNQAVVRNIAGVGFSKDMIAGFYIGRSSVYSAMQVAYYMDYAKVYIFGIDMCAVGGKLYPWGANPDVDDKNRMARFDKEAESYAYAAKHLSDAERARYVFCSTYNPYPFMQSFARLDQKTAVDAILDVSNKL